LIWPTILLPARFAELDRVKQKHILLHELAHISQRDALGHFLFNLLFPILYFHPLYWLLRRKTNLARELIADDLAAAVTSRESYVADLLALAKDRLAGAALASHALGLFQSKTDLYRRMHMLMQTNRPLARRCSIVWRVGYSTALVAALAMLSGTLGVRRAQAQAPDAQQNAVDKRNADEQANLAAQREAEVQRLRAEQDSIRAKLADLEQERIKLQDELAKRKAEGGAAANLTEIYKRNLNRRYGEEQKAKEATAAAVLAKIAATAQDDAALQKDKAGQNERQAMQDWMAKKNVGLVNRDQNDFPGRAQLDLVSLANNYVDAVGNLQLAQLEFDRLNGKEKVFTPYEIGRAKVQLQMAERKVAIFRRIAEAAIQSTKEELDIAKKQLESGIGPRTAVVEAESRLRILEVILAQ
jgi:hypothetical protein